MDGKTIAVQRATLHGHLYITDNFPSLPPSKRYGTADKPISI